MKRLSLIALLLASCGGTSGGTSSTTTTDTPPRITTQVKGENVHLGVYCDTQYGNLIYTAKWGGDGVGIAVVPGGCK